MNLAWDMSGTRSLNHLNQYRLWSRIFGIASRLGDGVFWYVLAGILPIIYGWEGLWASLVMLTAGGSCTIIYKLLKHSTARERPCTVAEGMWLTTAPLDRFSFPSGHTLHAVCFTLVACACQPWLGWILWPFTLLVALSRMVLGLHYPSDVLAGAVIGGAVAWVALPFL